MYGSLDVSTSGMVAQRTRMAVIAANIATRNTMLNAQGEVDPYRRREVFFSPAEDGQGVRVAAIEKNEDAVRWKYDPGSPFAETEGPQAGYVLIPDISPVVEQINAMEASRAYEANVAAAEASKSMVAQALRLLA